MDSKQTHETFFISNIDSSITSKDIIDVFQYTTNGIPQVLIHKQMISYNEFYIAEVTCTHNQALIAHQKLNNTKIKNCMIKLIPSNCMKSIIISNLPEIFSIKDLFLIMSNINPGLKRIIVAEDPEDPMKTLGVVEAIYSSFEHAYSAFQKLNGEEIFRKKISLFWKEPTFDIISTLSFETRALYIKNISLTTTAQGIRNTVSHFGNVNRIIQYATKIFVEFSSIAEAKQAYEALNEKRIDGTIWRIFPAKLYSEQRAKEEADKNLLYSKEFLDQEDQQTLLKVAMEAQRPSQIIKSQAKQLIESIFQLQKRQLDMLQIQCENMKMINSGGYQNNFGGNLAVYNENQQPNFQINSNQTGNQKQIFQQNQQGQNSQNDINFGNFGNNQGLFNQQKNNQMGNIQNQAGNNLQNIANNQNNNLIANQQNLIGNQQNQMGINQMGHSYNQMENKMAQGQNPVGMQMGNSMGLQIGNQMQIPQPQPQNKPLPQASNPFNSLNFGNQVQDNKSPIQGAILNSNLGSNNQNAFSYATN